MTKVEFAQACDSNASTGTWPEDWSELLKSLAYDRAGDWDFAHGIAQDIPSAPGSAVHAYLHRKEGVQWNAEYWYRRAGRPPFTGSLDEEWLALVDELLNLPPPFGGLILPVLRSRPASFPDSIFEDDSRSPASGNSTLPPS